MVWIYAIDMFRCALAGSEVFALLDRIPPANSCNKFALAASSHGLHFSDVDEVF